MLNTISYDPKRIIKIVALEYHVSVEDVVNKVMEHDVCDARNVAMLFIRIKNPTLAGRTITGYFNKGVSSFSYAKQNVEALLRTDKVFKLRYELCKILINNVDGKPKRKYIKK